jgi:hypothetical protein
MSAAEWCAQIREEPAHEEPAEAEAPAELESEAAIAEVAPAEAINAEPQTQGPKLRNGTCPQGVRSTKQALMIAMLRRPEGATVEQIAEARGWARHYADVRIMPTYVGNPACGAGIVAKGSA